MNLREIADNERPKCPQCDRPLAWVLTKSYYNEVCGWEFACNCIDTDILKPDVTFRMSP